MKTQKKFPNLHPDDSHYAFNRATRYLALRPRTKHEIEEYLLKKDFTQNATNAAIKRLIDLKFLDDHEFGETFTRSRQVYRGKSKFYIKYELKKKGLDEGIINEVVDKAQSDLEVARTFIERKRRIYSNLNKIEFREKMIRLLSSRGFSFDIIKNALKEE